MLTNEKRKGARRILRERGLQLLYAYELNNIGLEAMITEKTNDISDTADKDFFRALIQKVIIHGKEFDEELTLQADNWDLERVALIDRIIIRMGMCELLFFPDIPTKVTINEYIEVSKEFSTALSGKFINGILDKSLARFVTSGKVKKQGRGLFDSSNVHKKNHK